MSKAVRLNEAKFSLWEEERKKETSTVINPMTNKPIKLGGPKYLEIEKAYQKLIKRQVQNQTREQPLVPIKEEELDKLSKVLNIVAQHSKPNISAKIATIIPSNPYLYGVTTPKSENIRERAKTLQEQITPFLDEESTKELIMEVVQLIKNYESGLPVYKMTIKDIEIKPLNKDFVLKMQQFLDMELKNIRKRTRSQTTKTLLKTSTLTVKKQETSQGILKKLHSWSSKSSTYDNRLIYELIKANLKRYNETPTLFEKKLVNAVYEAYDIPKDIAAIYAFYIKYLLYIRLYDIISSLKFFTPDRIKRGDKILIPITFKVHDLPFDIRGSQ